MKLNINLGAAIVTLLFLMSMVGMRAELNDRWVAEEKPYTYGALQATPDPDQIPAFPDAFGFGATALQTCRDSVVNGSWDLKVWKVRPTSYDSSFAQMGVLSILRDSLSDDAFDIVIFTEGGEVATADSSGAADRYDLHINNDCAGHIHAVIVDV